jgi:GPH family glycoside/pentoside/hexuronide:cation symporter
MLRILYALVPCVCNFLAILIAFKYPITHGIHQEIRHKIESRFSGETVTDPFEPGRSFNAVRAKEQSPSSGGKRT